MASKMCWSINLAGFDIVLSQKGKDNFSVQYGKQLVERLPYTEAALELGAAIMHSLACEGKLNNEER